MIVCLERSQGTNPAACKPARLFQRTDEFLQIRSSAHIYPETAEHRDWRSSVDRGAAITVPKRARHPGRNRTSVPTHIERHSSNTEWRIYGSSRRAGDLSARQMAAGFGSRWRAVVRRTVPGLADNLPPRERYSADGNSGFRLIQTARQPLPAIDTTRGWKRGARSECEWVRRRKVPRNTTRSKPLRAPWI
jgi:hypothetical protein